MHMEGCKISLPVSVVSGNSGASKSNGKVITETFSEAYKCSLQNKVLLELGKIFRNVDGKSTSSIIMLNQAVNLLCGFMVQEKIMSLADLDSEDLSRLRDFIQAETTFKTEWRSVYNSLKINSSGTILANRAWPKATLGYRKVSSTPAHSIYAYNAMGVALRLEIDRIMMKKGRLVEAIKTGKLIRREDLELNGKGRPKGTLAPDFHPTKADIIRTITHYLPGWPVVNTTIRPDRPEGNWAVYDEYRGIRFGLFETEEKAAAFMSKKVNNSPTSGMYLTVLNQSSMNPAEFLLARFEKKVHFKVFGDLFAPLFESMEDLIDTYYPTVYDWQCVYLYWIWLTGWNNETVASVVASDLSLGIDIGKHDMVEVVAPDHTEVNGMLPTHWKRRELPVSAKRDKGEVITGYKTRSQPEDVPKAYSYISDKSNPYDLYLVLADFYELTKPLRRSGLLYQSEVGCILIGVPLNSNNKTGRQLSIFGGVDHTIPDYKTGISRFFERNPIFDDTLEFKNGPLDDMGKATDNPADSPERYTRIWATCKSACNNDPPTAIIGVQN